jgi:hypothetical protein
MTEQCRNTSGDKTLRFWQKLLTGLLVVILLPLLLILLVLWAVTSLVFYLLVWVVWRPRGKDILFVYSDSPIWRDYISEHVIPRIETRAMILNWSERRHWLHRWSLSSLLFRHFGGYREFNPIGIYFPPLRFHQSFRFWKAFRDWKHGNPETLKRIEEDFFRCIG